MNALWLAVVLLDTEFQFRTLDHIVTMKVQFPEPYSGNLSGSITSPNQGNGAAIPGNALTVLWALRRW